MTAHWGVPDPAAIKAPKTAQVNAFREAFHILDNRIRLFTSLRIDALDRMSLKRKVDEIGRAQAEPPQGKAS